MTTTVIHHVSLEQMVSELFNGGQFEGVNIDVIHDHFGTWINVVENKWAGSVNMGLVSMGLTFVDGQLFEMDPSAYFYRDEDPCWSPVVCAQNESVARLFEKMTGESFPILVADGSDPVEFKQLIAMKKAVGYNYIDEVFIQG